MLTYITLGQQHKHVVNKILFNKDSIVEIEAPDHESARQVAFSVFGEKWGTSYNEKIVKDILHHFPRGIIQLNLIPKKSPFERVLWKMENVLLGKNTL